VDPQAIRFLTPEQVAQRTGLSCKAIYRAIDRGQLTAYRLCGRLRIAATDEQAWIEQNRVSPAVSAVPDADLCPRPAASEHSLRRLLAKQENSTGLAGTRSYDPTPENGNAPAATGTPRGRQQGESP
jgi:excisionase family DNA binding protein